MLPRTGYSPPLDGLRAIAIGLVLLHHLRALIGGNLGWLTPLADAGWIGVDVFFALSGFLITGILLSAAGEACYFRNFYTRRVLRIFPLYYGVLTIVFAARSLAPGLPEEARPSPLWFYGFLSNFWFARQPACTDLTLTVTWSLSVEEQFYLVWPLLVRCMSRRTLKLVLLGVILFGPLWRWGLATNAQTLAHTLCRMDGLAFGALTALWWFERGTSGMRVIRPLAAGLVIGLAVTIAWGGFQHERWGIPVVEYALVPAATAAAILAMLGAPGGAAARLLSAAPLAWVGRISFGLYLLHPLCFTCVRDIAVNAGWTTARTPAALSVVFAAAAVGLSLACAGASYQLLERRCLALKDRLAPRAGRPPAGLGPVAEMA